MGRAIANATNAAQGWRKPAPRAETLTIEEPKMGHDYSSKMGEGKCGGGSWRKRYAGNSYRGRHDDGSRKSRSRAGARNQKHSSPTTR